jgi:hypothetical protein
MCHPNATEKREKRKNLIDTQRQRAGDSAPSSGSAATV